MIRIVFTITSLLFFHSLFAQDNKGHILVAVKPEKAIVRFDTTNISNFKGHLHVDTGMHVIRAWAPGRQLVTDTVSVNSKKPFVYRIELPYTAEYKAYAKARNKYRTNMVLTRYVPWAVTLAVAVYFPLQYKNEKDAADDYYEEAIRYKETYESLTDAEQIATYKAGYEQSKANYEDALEKSDNAATTAMIAIPAAVAVSTGLYFFSRKFERPVFEEEPLLSGLSFSVLPPVTDRTTRAVLTIRF